MSDLSVKIIGAGLCEEGIAVEKLEAENKRLNDLIASNDLICPHCKTKLFTSEYEGYYDTFTYWSCACDVLPVDKKNKWRGQYV